MKIKGGMKESKKSTEIEEVKKQKESQGGNEERKH